MNKELNDIENMLSGYNTEATVNTDSVATEIEPEKKVETRGRKKGSKFKTNEPLQSEPKTVTGGELISGSILLLFIDLAIPNILCFGYNAINKGKKKKLKADIMQLSTKQKSELEPLANEAAKQLLIHASPLSVFIISLITIYGLNFMMVAGANDSIEKKVKK
jgi:hypothetical protein